MIEASAEDRISKPVEAVFDAIVDPERMANYFITRGNSPMIEGKTVTWFFDDVGGQLDAVVKQVERNKRIVFEWSASGADTEVVITLEATDPQTTTIQITESEFPVDKDGLDRVLEQTRGWMNFLDCLKAYLLFGINLRQGTKATSP